MGIVGLSGSGKSTLLKILSCELFPQSGSLTLQGSSKKILFDFKDISQLQTYRDQISIVSQESHLFTASLGFNIAMGLSGGEDMESFWERVTELVPYLKTWGVSLDQELNPKELSLGQKQLLGALRACYLKRSVVLFDEISSGLDSFLELALRQLVLLVQKQALTIIVAHRLETLVYAHKILVMDEGSLVAQGQHAQLVEMSPLYRDFIAHLSSEEKKFDVFLQSDKYLLT